MKKLSLVICLLLLFTLVSCKPKTQTATSGSEDEKHKVSSETTEPKTATKYKVEYRLDDQIDFVLQESNLENVALFEALIVENYLVDGSDLPILVRPPKDQPVKLLTARLLVEWYMDEELTEKASTDLMPTEDLVLYGKLLAALSLASSYENGQRFNVYAGIFNASTSKLNLESEYFEFDYRAAYTTGHFTEDEKGVVIFKDTIEAKESIAYANKVFYYSGNINNGDTSGGLSQETYLFASKELKELEINAVCPDGNIKEKTFKSSSYIEKLVINSDVATIEASAFTGMNNIKEIIINGNVNLIKTNAFASLPNLEKVIINGELVETEDSIFSNCNMDAQLINNK